MKKNHYKNVIKFISFSWTIVISVIVSIFLSFRVLSLDVIISHFTMVYHALIQSMLVESKLLLVFIKRFKDLGDIKILWQAVGALYLTDYTVSAVKIYRHQQKLVNNRPREIKLENLCYYFIKIIYTRTSPS